MEVVILVGSGCGSETSPTGDESYRSSPSSTATPSADVSSLGDPVAGLRGVPVPALAVPEPAPPSAATETAVYSVPAGSPLSEWYAQWVRSGQDLDGGWEYCEDGPSLGIYDAGRIWTKPGSTGVDVLEVTASNELGKVNVLYTEDGWAC